jgi:hypothetical protein
MATQISGRGTEAHSADAMARQYGFLAALLLAFMAAVGFGLGIFTPPRSGPWCTANCTAYPFVDAGRFFPRDYWWMIPALMLAPLLMTLAACVHFCVPPARRLWSLLAVCCATAATALIAMDYLAQVLVVQPSLAQHESDGVAMLTQYNPHGLFILLEDLGYLLLAKALWLLAMAMPADGRLTTGLRWTMWIVSGLTFASFFFFAVRFGTEMALPFELAVITIVWIGLIPIGMLLAIWFRRVRLTH